MTEKESLETARRLVRLIKDRPRLFDRTIYGYVKDKLWEEIGQELNLSIPECQSKWLELRNKYTQCLHKLREGKNCKSSFWEIFKEMNFLNKHVIVKSYIYCGNDSSSDENDGSTSRKKPLLTGTKSTNIQSNPSKICRKYAGVKEFFQQLQEIKNVEISESSKISELKPNEREIQPKTKVLPNFVEPVQSNKSWVSNEENDGYSSYGEFEAEIEIKEENNYEEYLIEIDDNEDVKPDIKIEPADNISVTTVDESEDIKPDISTINLRTSNDNESVKMFSNQATMTDDVETVLTAESITQPIIEFMRNNHLEDKWQSNDRTHSLVKFFNGVITDYNQLSSLRQIIFKKKCHDLLYNLLFENEEDQNSTDK